MPRLNVIVTCGPSLEPIDEVRRITNFSTGELGVGLSRALAAAGFDVLCLKGSGATHPDPGPPCRVQTFDTNDDLLARLEVAARRGRVAAVFHAAALCDYRVARIRNDAGRRVRAAKIASRAGGLTLELEPATKVIHALRPLFPRSLIVGWKYELSGTRAAALAKARRQLAENHTDACVVNGRAFGPGFGFCVAGARPRLLAAKPALAAFLVDWLQHGRR